MKLYKGTYLQNRKLLRLMNELTVAEGRMEEGTVESLQ